MSAYRSESHVRLAYDLERDDFVRALRAQRGRRTFATAIPMSALIVAAVSAPMFWRLPLEAAALATGAVAIALGILVWAALRVNLKQLDRTWDDRRSQRLDITEDVFEIHDRVSGKRIAWELVVHWRETADAFLVFVEPHMFHLIPKRLIPNAEVQTSLRRLLQDRVPPGGEERVAVALRGSWIPFTTFAGIFAVLVAAAIEAVAAVLFL